MGVSNNQYKIVDQIKASESPEEFKDCFRTISEHTNFDFFLFALALPNTVNEVDVIVYDNYPAKWRTAYDAQGFSKKDPIVRYCVAECLPVKWSDVTQEKGFTEEDESFMAMANEFGLGPGFSVPLHAPNGGVGVVSLALEPGAIMSEFQFREALGLIQSLQSNILDTARNIQKERVSGFADLTKREIEALVWTAEGKSSWEIAQILGIKERTVNFHIAQASTKLGANNRTRAVSTALLTGILHPLIA